MHCNPDSALVANQQQTNKAITILVADDYPTSRYLLIEMLAEVFPMAKFFEAGDGNEVLIRLGQHSIDLLLLDVNMPRRSGLEVLPDVRVLFPNTRVIILSVHPEYLYATLALEAGALAYLSKDNVPEELIPTVKSVLSADAAESKPACNGARAAGLL